MATASRFDLPPLPDPGPDFGHHIVEAIPVWAISSEERALRLSLCRVLLDQGHARPDCLAAAQGLLTLAFQEEPFDATGAALLESAEAIHPFLPPKALAMLRLVRAAASLPADDVSGDDILATGDPALLVRYGLAAAKDRQNALARLAPVYRALLRLPDASQAQAVLQAFTVNLPPLLAGRLLAEFAVLRLPPEAALAVVDGLDPQAWGLYAAIAASCLRERLGDREGALDACLAARRVLPYHVNLTLRAHALAVSRPVAPEPEPDAAAVCVYSMNKAEVLRECLAHLATTRLGGAVVAVLDNGSTDHTPDVLAAAADLFPEGRFVSVRLPVNIGAPGARNWLLSLPEVKARPFTAFVDDDAFPETDWLARLLQTAARYPQAGAIGCAIADRTPPGDMQSADYNLFPPQMGQSSLPEITERLFVCDACRTLPDDGLVAYTRPCLSVSGCCHLLRRAAIEAAGPFDIRFNPTQFDDLERDIRSWLAGYPAVYDGTVRVAHQQASSLAKAQTPAQTAHILGNKIKLESSVSDRDADRLWRENLAVLGRDFLEKDAALRS